MLYFEVQIAEYYDASLILFFFFLLHWIAGRNTNKVLDLFRDQSTDLLKPNLFAPQDRYLPKRF